MRLCEYVAESMQNSSQVFIAGYHDNEEFVSLYTETELQNQSNFLFFLLRWCMFWWQLKNQQNQFSKGLFDICNI